MPWLRIRHEWNGRVKGKERLCCTEGLKAKYGKCEPARTESAALHSGLGIAGSGHGHADKEAVSPLFRVLLW